MLYLKTSPNWEDWNDLRLVLPWAHHTLAMHGCHDDLGHLGTEHMLDILHDQFYWTTMQDDAEQQIQEYGRCNWFKACPHHEKLYPILATYLLESVYIDFLMMMKSQEWERHECIGHKQPFLQIHPSNS